MKNFNNIGRGLALATSTLALGSVMAVSGNISSAQAVTFTPGTSSTINFSGASTITNIPTFASPLTTPVGVSFSNITVQSTSNGDFTSLIGSGVTLPTLTLSNPVATTTPTVADVQYNTVLPTNPIFLFDQSVSFVANSLSGLATAKLTSVGTATFDISPIQGTFFDTLTNTALGFGSLTFNGNLAVLGSISGTLSINVPQPPTETPEPTTTVALAALGLGAFFTKSLVKKNKVAVNA